MWEEAVGSQPIGDMASGDGSDDGLGAGSGAGSDAGSEFPTVSSERSAS
jgi:hypothetical protein